MTILDSRGVFLCEQNDPEPRPAGPWSTNADPRARRGAGVREALAGEIPRAAREASTIERMNATHPGASWHFVTHPTVGRILVSVPENVDASAEVLAELANGRRV